MNFQERFKGRTEMLSGKQEPSLQRPIEKAVKAYKLHTDNPVSPIKISATTVTRPLSFRSQVTYTPEKGSVRSVQSHRPCLSGRLSQDAPFQLVASNSLGLSRPVDFSCLEESPQRRTSHKPAQPLYDTSWMEYLSPAAYSSGLEDSSRRDYSSVQWQSAYSAPRRPVQSNYVPVGRVRDRRVRSLSEGFTLVAPEAVTLPIMKSGKTSPPRHRSKSKQSIDKKQAICITIQLKGGSEPVALSENFVKVLEKEYAVKYLELMHVAPTAKNIQGLLKDVPLSACEIKAGWHGSGWLADVIHIYPTRRNKNQGLNLIQEGAFPTDSAPEEAKQLQREDSGLSPSHFKRHEQAAKPQDEAVNDKQHLILDAETIKKRYLYPFFVTNGESQEGGPAAASSIAQETLISSKTRRESASDLLSSKIFQFPFDRVTVPSLMIKEVLQPITVRLETVMEDLKHISTHFPLGDFQVAIESAQKTIALEAALQTACSEKSARLLGLMTHFCYFTVFGHIQNVPLSPAIQHQLFTQIVLLFHENEDLAKGGRLFLNLPMLLLVIRIEIEGVFRVTYPKFFEVKAQAEMALQKIQSVITTLLDPDYYYSRLSFLESGLDAVALAAQAGKQMRGKYYSISALVKSLFPNPSHPRTRALLARKDALEGRLDNLVKTGAQIAGTMPLAEGRLNYYQQSEPWKTTDYLDVKSRAQLYTVIITQVAMEKAKRDLKRLT